MSTKLNVHPLLQRPSEVSVASRNALAAAYHEKVDGLTGKFRAAGEVLEPVVPVTVYYYSDNDGALKDTAPKEIQRFLQDSASIVEVLSGIKRPEIVHQDTLAQGWVTGGFDLAQTTRYGLSGVGNVTFLNCAPRLDERGKEENKSNKGEPIYVAVLPNGHVISANSRYNFTHFRDMVENGTLEVFEAAVQEGGTQFRSRDIFPTHLMVLANQLTQNGALWKPEMSLAERRELLEAVGYVDTNVPLTLDRIPELEPFTISNRDVHGNLKLNVRLSELDPAVVDKLKADPFQVIINGRPREARFTERMFDRGSGETGISTGSSGHDWQGAENSDGFLEISIIGGDAAQEFGLEPELLRKEVKVLIPGVTPVSNDNVLEVDLSAKRDRSAVATSSGPGPSA